MDQVILVNEKDEAIGVMEKTEVHQKALLHRAFSIFIFNHQGDMLLQQRAYGKYHSGGLWTNACCSHPRPGEDTQEAALRRLREELGFDTDLKKVFEFTYQTHFDNGLTEFEFDHVYVGQFDGDLKANQQEVNDYCYMSMANIEEWITREPKAFSSWFAIAWPRIKQWYSQSNN